MSASGTLSPSERQSFAWVPHVFAIELKKALSYRAAFWIQFLFGTLTDMGVAYFLWSAVFAERGEAILQGYTFHGIVYYYLFATFSMKIARGAERGSVSQEIYDGGLTRYLVYPLPFLVFKYVTHLTQELLGVVQLLIAFAALWLVMGAPGGDFTVSTFLAGVLTCFLAGYLHFAMSVCLEMVAFWQDVVWNLMAMLRFTMSLLGGAMIPLAFFPEWGQKFVSLTPFPSIIAFPAKTFLGQVTWLDWVSSVGILAVWSIVFSFLASAIWSRGLKKYSGVGI